MTTIRTLAAACAVSMLSLGLAMAQTPAQTPAPAAGGAAKDKSMGTAAPQAEKAYEPVSGQAGKDVVWVPTDLTLVNAMLDMAKATPEDYVIDLGSGDGRTVITAAKRGIKALGIEYNPDLVALSKRNAEREGAGDKATFKQADIFETDFSQATVLTLFLLPELNLRLRPTILDMKPGTRVVSNTFTMENWQADQTIEVSDGCASYCRAYKWIVPAKVGGSWKMPNGELKLEQTFQMLSGTLTTGTKQAKIEEAKMTGTQIEFTADGRRYTGKVEDGRMTGTTEVDGKSQEWSATRAGG
jgi:precorrin-6B methylase 2